MEQKIRHLEMIQGIINRMASNSFALKGWAVTLVAGIFALANKDANEMYFLVAYIPIILFWFLDSYYLQLEKKYRLLYDKARLKEDKEINFDMDISKDEFKVKETHYIACLVSKTEFGFYIPFAVLCAGIIIINNIL